MLDVIERSGGYTKSAYPFGASLYRKSTQHPESFSASRKAYRNPISFIASNPESLSGANDGLGYVLAEIKSHKPVGRIIADFDPVSLKESIQKYISE